MSTTVAPLIPTKVGIQGCQCGLFRLGASSLFTWKYRSWIPIFVGMSGDEIRYRP